MKNAGGENTLVLGAKMEGLACEFLQAQGLIMVRRNFRCRMGEIDLIMNDRGTLVFVEVRYRQSNRYGGARESITPAKQQKIVRTAQIYLKPFAKCPPCRFDVVLIEGKEGEGSPEWIKGAW